MNDNSFNAVDIEYNIWFRIGSEIKGFMGRGNTYKVFCNAIGYEPGRKTSLPKEYLINHARLDVIAAKRDKIILAIRARYDKNMGNLARDINNTEIQIRDLEKYLENKKKILTECKNRLEKEKDPSNIIALESRVESIQANIENQTQVKDELEAKLECFKEVIVSNKEQWNNQVKIINDEYKNQSSKFCQNLGRKITKKFGYNDFIYISRGYSKSVKKLINEE